MSKYVCSIGIVLFCLNSFSFEKEIVVYGVIKPASITTLLSVNHGIVIKIPKQVGDSVNLGGEAIHVLEKETTRILRSGIAGQVAKIHVTQGAAVTPGMPLITILDPYKKDIEISLSASEAKEVKPGQLVARANDGSDFGKISKISPLVDPDTGGVLAYVSPNDKINDLVGDVVSLRISVGKIDSCKEVPIAQLSSPTEDTRIIASSKDKVCLETKGKSQPQK